MESKSFCQMCGQEAQPGAVYCIHCGARLPEPVFAPAATVPDPGAPSMTPSSAAAGMAPAAAPAPVIPETYIPSFSSTVPAPVHYGGFWIRLVAVFIDGLIVEMVVLPISFVLGGMIGVASMATRMPDGGARIVGAIVGFVMGIAGSWIYEAAMESSSKQATLGKMLFGLQVTDLEGNRISFGRATARHFGKYLSGLIFLIGYIMAGFSERKQALHDILAGTLVRYSR